MSRRSKSRSRTPTPGRDVGAGASDFFSLPRGHCAFSRLSPDTHDAERDQTLQPDAVGGVCPKAPPSPRVRFARMQPRSDRLAPVVQREASALVAWLDLAVALYLQQPIGRKASNVLDDYIH